MQPAIFQGSDVSATESAPCIPANTLAAQINALFDAERTRAPPSRRARPDRGERAGDALVAELRAEADARSHSKDHEELALRLVRIAGLLGDLHGGRRGRSPRRHPRLRRARRRVTPPAKRSRGLAYDRFKEVALGIERALARLPRGQPGADELPFLLAEIPEPGAVKLLGKFLEHADAEAVAAAIEALVEVGDPPRAPLLAPLEKDTRQVQLEDEEGEEERVTIGELATKRGRSSRRSRGSAARARRGLADEKGSR